MYSLSNFVTLSYNPHYCMDMQLPSEWQQREENHLAIQLVSRSDWRTLFLVPVVLFSTVPLVSFLGDSLETRMYRSVLTCVTRLYHSFWVMCNEVLSSLRGRGAISMALGESGGMPLPPEIFLALRLFLLHCPSY